MQKRPELSPQPLPILILSKRLRLSFSQRSDETNVSCSFDLLRKSALVLSAYARHVARNDFARLSCESLKNFQVLVIKNEVLISDKGAYFAATERTASTRTIFRGSIKIFAFEFFTSRVFRLFVIHKFNFH